MQANNVVVPDPGTTVETIVDNIGGWIYVVTTTIGVEQKSFVGFQEQLAAAKERTIAAQKEEDILAKQVADLTVAAFPAQPAVSSTPTATSTPVT